MPPVRTILMMLALLGALACKTEVTDRNRPGGGVPPLVVDIQPPFAATGVAPTAVVRVAFSTPVEPSTVNGTSLYLTDLSTMSRVAGTISLNPLATGATFVPEAPLALGVTHELMLTRGIRDTDGTSLFVMAIAVPVPSTFTVTATPDTQPPTFAGLATAAAASDRAVTLGWTAATDDQSAAADLRYAVYAAGVSGGQDFGAPQAVTAPGATSHLVTGLPPSATTFFVVRALDLHGNEDGNLVELSATTAATPDATPPVFGGLTGATPLGPSGVLLSWTAATDNADPAARLRYRVFVEEAAGQQSYAAPFLETAAGTTSVAVEGLAPGEWFFAVKAVDSSDNVDGNLVEASGVTQMSYRRSIQPVHLLTCATSGCHTTSDLEGGLSLETFAEFQAGGISGTPYVAGMPDISLVVRRIDDRSPQYIGPLMPFGGMRLPDRDIVILQEWIRQGALDN